MVYWALNDGPSQSVIHPTEGVVLDTMANTVLRVVLVFTVSISIPYKQTLSVGGRRRAAP